MIKKVINLKTPSVSCQKCQGRLYVTDSKARQKAVMQKFGKIPNDCVNDNNGHIHCPYKQS